MMRQRMGMTQEELSLRCDLTQGYINFLENGKRGYSEKSLERIAHALGVQISELFVEKGEKATDMVAEPNPPYGKRRRVYDNIIDLLNKLPTPVIDHYRIILQAEIDIRSKDLK